jgi:hypothetical protein
MVKGVALVVLGRRKFLTFRIPKATRKNPPVFV